MFPCRVVVLARAVHPLHGYGGLERHVGDLVRHLSRRGVTTTLITRPPSSGEHDAGVLARHGVSVRFSPYWTFPFAGRRGTTVLDRSTAYLLFGERVGRAAAQLAAAGSVDVVHGLGASALGFARRRPRGAGAAVPFVFNPQGLEEFGSTARRQGTLKRIAYGPLQRAVRLCARTADCVLATDRSLEGPIRSHLGVEPARIRLVPNAIDLEVCDRQARPEDGARVLAGAGIANGLPVLVSVGRLESNKGFDVLARALRRSRRDLAPDWRWVLVGDGPARRAIERAIGEAGIGDRVVLTGRVSDDVLHAWLEAATLFVHPTLYEGSSLVTLEAMAHRKAVVATDAGGLPDKVEPGWNGWLVPPGDPDALGRAISDALASRDRLPDMGQRGRELVEREFSWTSVIERQIEVYREQIERRRAER